MTQRGVGSFCVDPSTGRRYDGSFVMTAAAGDELYGRFAGEVEATSSTAFDEVSLIRGEFRTTGGTGRFVGVSGGGTVNGAQSDRTGEFDLFARGTVRLPGRPHPVRPAQPSSSPSSPKRRS